MSNDNTSPQPAWQEKYKTQIMAAPDAVEKIRPGQRIFIGTGCAEPLELVTALTKRAYDLPDTEILHLLTFGDAPYAHKELAQYFRVNSFFIAENVRNIIQEGLGDYTPINLSDIPRLFNSGQLPLDVALIQVTPPDEHGMCSLGVSVDIVKSATENASLVIAQVNPKCRAPWAIRFIHVYDIDILVPADAPILEVKPAEVNETTRHIAENVVGADRGRRDAGDRHRPDSAGAGQFPQGQKGSRHSHGDDFRRGGRVDRGWHHHRRAQDAGPRQGGRPVSAWAPGSSTTSSTTTRCSLFTRPSMSTTRLSFTSSTKWWPSTRRWKLI